MFFWYKILTYLFYFFSPIYFFFRKLKKKEHKIRYKEKLSKITIKRNDGQLIWFHVASVGEGLSILPIVEELEKEEKIKTILITSITLSSAEVLKKKLFESKKTIHQFLPLDVPFLINKFLKHWSPNLSIFVDSEIWPNTIRLINKKKIPLLLINARITKKTFSRWIFLKKFSKNLFDKFDLCIVANKESENYLKILGVKNIKNYGNLKFSETKNNIRDNLDSAMLEKIINRKTWCAASTHKSEEIFCAKTHLDLKKNYKNILTIIIPRHIDRIKKINKELSNLKLKVALYSNLNEINPETDILLVDAYGENSKFFSISKSVFMGGSIIKHGGQNPIEASRYGCKIFYGPNVANFSEIYEFLNSLSAAKLVNTHKELNQSLVEEFESQKSNSNQLKKTINNYGTNVLNSVIKDLKKYISI